MASDAIEQIRNAEQQAAQMERDAEAERTRILDQAQNSAAQVIRDAREQAKRKSDLRLSEAARQSDSDCEQAGKEAQRRQEDFLAGAAKNRGAAVRRVMDLVGLF